MIRMILFSFLLSQAHHLFSVAEMKWYGLVCFSTLIIFMQSCVIYKKTSFCEIHKKSFALLSEIYWLLLTIEAFTISYLDYKGGHNPSITIFIIIAEIVFCLFFAIKILTKEFFNHKFDSFLNPSKAYLIYYKPKNFMGLLGYIFFYNYGGVAIWFNGRLFGFKHGRYIEITDRKKKCFYLHKGKYKLIGKATNVLQKNIKKSLGVKWTPFNNCFTVTKRILKYKRGVTC